jgi:hypothetical protein
MHIPLHLSFLWIRSINFWCHFSIRDHQMPIVVAYTRLLCCWYFSLAQVSVSDLCVCVCICVCVLDYVFYVVFHVFYTIASSGHRTHHARVYPHKQRSANICGVMFWVAFFVLHLQQTRTTTGHLQQTLILLCFVSCLHPCTNTHQRYIHDFLVSLSPCYTNIIHTSIITYSYFIGYPCPPQMKR